MGQVEKGNLDEVFTYHSPTPEQQAKYSVLRYAAGDFAKVILDNVPACADRAAALRHVREAMMTANAAVALDGMI